jgi:hypothetical protein
MSAARPQPRTVLVVAGLAAFLYSNFIIDWVLRGFEGMGEIVSELESPGEPNAALLRVTDCICAALVIVLTFWARSAMPRGVWREVFAWSTVVFALGAVAAAVVPEPCGPGVLCTAPDQVLQSDIHGWASVVSDTALFVGVLAAILANRRTAPAWFTRTAWLLLILGGGVASLLFGWFDRTKDPDWAAGLFQRLHIVSISIWIVTLGLFTARAERRHP